MSLTRASGHSTPRQCAGATSHRHMGRRTVTNTPDDPHPPPNTTPPSTILSPMQFPERSTEAAVKPPVGKIAPSKYSIRASVSRSIHFLHLNRPEALTYRLGWVKGVGAAWGWLGRSGAGRASTQQPGSLTHLQQKHKIMMVCVQGTESTSLIKKSNFT